MASQPQLNIVRLDAIHCAAPTFRPDFAHNYTEYPLTAANETAARMIDANIAITSTVRITSEDLQLCPNLKLIAVMATGTDIIDLSACKERGVQVCNIPGASSESVAEHAISLYFAARRRTARLHDLMANGSEWKRRGTLKGEFGAELPRIAREETLGIFGVGDIGNRIANICKALGMKVIFADRKTASLDAVRPGCTLFAEAIRNSTVLVITCPHTPETTNLISTPELSIMRTDAIIINVARGGIVDEAALVQALREGKIAGAAADVYLTEPATKENSPLVQAASEEGIQGKLTLTPHVAWAARSSIQKLRGTVTTNIEAWARGEPENLVL